MRIRSQHVHVFHGSRKRAQGLNGIETEEDMAIAQILPNGLVINPETADKVAGRQRDHPRVLIHLAHYVLGPDDAQTARVHQSHFHPLLCQRHPRIHVRRIIVEVDQDVIAAPQLQPAGQEAQRQRGRAHKGDFVSLTLQQLRGQLAALVQDRRIDELLLVAGGGFASIVGDRLRHASRQRTIARVRQEDLIPRDGKLMLAQLFVAKDLG